mgnify:CR=1 FL=1
MSLTANISPANMALTGNPIKLSINSSSLATYIISIGNQEIFTGSGEGNFFIFIQEILANVVQPAQLYNESEDILLQAENCSKNITINISNNDGNTQTLSLKVFIGGVSKRILRHLNDENKNVFIWKLMNPEGNFFQTTRTSGKLITIAPYSLHLPRRRNNQSRCQQHRNNFNWSNRSTSCPKPIPPSKKTIRHSSHICICI